MNKVFILHLAALKDRRHCFHLTGVPAAELHRCVTRVIPTITIVLVAEVHAVGVTIAAPAHGNAQPIHPTLELFNMAAASRAGLWRNERN